MRNSAIEIYQIILGGKKVLHLAHCPSCRARIPVKTDQLKGHIGVRCQADECDSTFVIDPHKIEWR